MVLADDSRLFKTLRREEVIPFGSRIPTRLATEHASRKELLACLNNPQAGAVNACICDASIAAHPTLSRCNQSPHRDDLGGGTPRRGRAARSG